MERTSNEIQVREQRGLNIFESLESFEAGQRMAKMFAQSDIVPATFKGSVGNCVIALDMANRLSMNPLMVMQNLYVVHGTPSWSSKFMIACFNVCGRFTPIAYESNVASEKDENKWACRAVTTSKETGEKLTGTVVSMKMADKEGWAMRSGSKWKTMPEQMLKYRAAAFLIRTVAPEITLGFYTKEEVEDGVLIEDGVVTEEELKNCEYAEEVAQEETEACHVQTDGRESQGNEKAAKPVDTEELFKNVNM